MLSIYEGVLKCLGRIEDEDISQEGQEWTKKKWIQELGTVAGRSYAKST